MNNLSTAADASNSVPNAFTTVDLVAGAAAELSLFRRSHRLTVRLRSFTAPDDLSGNQRRGSDRHKLIAMGIGPKNGMVGNTMVSAPLETAEDDSKAVYCRYIAIFAIYQSGKPAQSKAVVDHRFKTLDKHIDQYNTSGREVSKETVSSRSLNMSDTKSAVLVSRSNQ